MTEPDITEEDLPPLEYVHAKGIEDAWKFIAQVFVGLMILGMIGAVALLK